MSPGVHPGSGSKRPAARSVQSSVLLVLSVLTALVLAGCGSTDIDPQNDVPDMGLTPVKSYLTEHSADLALAADRLRTEADAYFRLARKNGFNYRRLLKRDCPEVDLTLTAARNALIKAKPAYEEMRAIVAGIPRTAQYDTDLAAGTDADDPESAVSFNLNLADDMVMRQPGNLIFLLETSLYGTNQAVVAEGVNPDVNCDGRVDFGEGLPDGKIFKVAAAEFARQTGNLDSDAREIVISESDAFTAVAAMTPTMSEYFGEWRRSAYVAGENEREEDGFVATSRLSDVADILTGILFTYGEIRPLIAEENEDRAERIGTGLKDLLIRAEDLRDREAAGESFTPEQADELGVGMQARAEAIAAQVIRAAEELGIRIQDD